MHSLQHDILEAFSLPDCFHPLDSPDSICQNNSRALSSRKPTTLTLTNNKHMGPLGYPEMVVIFLIILLLFGAKKLPQLARGLGKSMGEFRKAKDEFEHEITKAEDEVTQDTNAKSAAPKDTQPQDEKDV